jgi:hypothetical protein
VAVRLRLAELALTVVDAFYRDEIGVGHIPLPVRPRSPAARQKPFPLLHFPLFLTVAFMN